jgi:hypothetical protein
MNQKEYFFKVKTGIDRDYSYEVLTQFPEWNIVPDIQTSH